MDHKSHMERIESILSKLYGAVDGKSAYASIAAMLDRYETPDPPREERFSQSDVILIAYGDSLHAPGQAPLQTLGAFASQFLQDSFSGIHLLPFYPFSSDDGFSVVDFHEVNPALGKWSDIVRIGQTFDLMVDFVLNHVSAQSPWFEAYLNDAPGFEDLAIDVDPSADLSAVTRPRALPLRTPFRKRNGEMVHVWTTFSADQVDLNYGSADVLCKMVDVLLAYVDRGARWIRMDAVAYLWKTVGTACIHQPETFAMIRLFRHILDVAAPQVGIITETNVPHEENILYFGQGRGLAQLVYNFSLPPLLLHALTSGDARILSRWAEGLHTPSEETTFFNFTASHDGIGVRPLEGLLPKQDIAALIQHVKHHSGYVSKKQNRDGSTSPYELNIVYLDAMGGDPRRFMASQAIALVLPGVPAVYIHSLLGSRNWLAGVEETGRARTINREPLALAPLLAELREPDSMRHTIFNAYSRMLAVRRRQPAFHPNAAYQVLDLGAHLFGVRRDVDAQGLVALTNMVDRQVTLDLTGRVGQKACRHAHDLLGGGDVALERVVLTPYQSRWLEL